MEGMFAALRRMETSKTQNKGVVSAAKRKNHFAVLTDEEIAEMEQAVRESHLVE